MMLSADVLSWIGWIVRVLVIAAVIALITARAVNAEDDSLLEVGSHLFLTTIHVIALMICVSAGGMLICALIFFFILRAGGH